MREWEGVLERFYEGDAERPELEGLSELDVDGTRAVAEALQLADGLRALCGKLEPPGIAEQLGDAPVLLEDEDETSEEREALLGADLTKLLLPFTPEEFLTELAVHKAKNPGFGIAKSPSWSPSIFNARSLMSMCVSSGW